MLRRLIGEDVVVKAIKEPALGNIKADPSQMEQVLLNLAVNARDAMPRGGKIVFNTENVELTAEQLAGNHDNVPGPYVLLMVSDNGRGMDKATLSRIFEPFFTTKGAQGTGLGLATVFGIVKQSHGIIDVVSAPGQGTTFKIYLPRVGEAISPMKCPSNVPESLRGSETIMLAEDDAGVRTLTRHLLQANGYSVLEAANGAEAIRMFEKEGDTIALLIADVVMPNMSGRELAEKLEERWPNTKLLYVSGYTEDAVVHYGVCHDQTHFLQKPFNPAGLALKVREVLNAP
jgi:CheY-like chemotaxis protein